MNTTRVQWSHVVARYRVGDILPPLVGSSVMTVDALDDTALCIRQLLWRACLTPDEFATAVGILDEAGSVTGLELAELLRQHYAGGPQVTTDCSRVPNLCAVLLADFGLVRRASQP